MNFPLPVGVILPVRASFTGSSPWALPLLNATFLDALILHCSPRRAAEPRQVFLVFCPPAIALAPLLRAFPPVAMPFLPLSLARLSPHSGLLAMAVPHLLSPRGLWASRPYCSSRQSRSADAYVLAGVDLVISKDCSLLDRILAFPFFLTPS